ncbi:hypothetical protein ACFUCQ_19055 [Streptomyces sp. NPDC057197]|uniref:hypothetical protein n=1 Tax=unclassified Streptomyces TaxID=2593676 RepID=UPI0033A04164
MLIEWGEPRRLGVPESTARLDFTEERREAENWPGRRVLTVDGDPAFELSFWCGTCPLLFRRLDGSRQTFSTESERESPTVAPAAPAGTEDRIDEDLVDRFGALLPEGTYVPVLLSVEPRLVVPGREGDYFSDEQVATWGVDRFWGLPEYPHTPYYRTFETPVDASGHFYEFVVPMVPPPWNERERVEQYVERMGRGTVPAAVAVSTLDVCEPGSGSPADHYRHWGLTHFLLDGHHRLEAAATAGRPVRLLSLLALDAGLSGPEEHARLPGLRTRPRADRVPSTD